jgi:sugar phosphate isomerase/epimerase
LNHQHKEGKSENQVKFAVFTKPWKTLSVWELGKFISELGFDGIEFPLRKGPIIAG